jgi:hypothetical protein
MDCPVCLDQLDPFTFSMRLPCGHVLHVACVAKHFEYEFVVRDHDMRCPLCRAEIGNVFEAVEAIVDATCAYVDVDAPDQDAMMRRASAAVGPLFLLSAVVGTVRSTASRQFSHPNEQEAACLGLLLRVEDSLRWLGDGLRLVSEEGRNPAE